MPDTLSAPAAGNYFEVNHPASGNTNEVVSDVAYRLWVPDGVRTLRGVMVHQHGCGVGSWKGAVPGARDLHWQALAKKWDCALLVPPVPRISSIARRPGRGRVSIGRDYTPKAPGDWRTPRCFASPGAAAGAPASWSAAVLRRFSDGFQTRWMISRHLQPLARRPSPLPHP